MKSRREKDFNPKRKLVKLNTLDAQQISDRISQVSYGGNPEHKKNPGDFGLTPPAAPRQGKALCDVANIFKRSVALDFLRQGMYLECISDRFENEWPKNVWAVTEDNAVLEYQLENPERGSYHGYPLPGNDPMVAEVLTRWTRIKNV